MAIDWTVPQPSYEDLHAKIDALQTERNTAAATTKLWLHRLQEAQRERDDLRRELNLTTQALSDLQHAFDGLTFRHRMLEVTADALVHPVEEPLAGYHIETKVRGPFDAA